MTQIIRLFPGRLNLNGDQANAVVLQKRAEWAGLAVDVIDYEEVSTIRPLIEALRNTERFVVIIGHGSLAAMESIRHLREQIIELLDMCKLRGQAALIVGSCAEWLLEHTQGERVSEFWSGSITFYGVEHDVNGYLNSQALLEPIYLDGSLIYTLLHGPLLTKSESLADALISKITSHDVSFNKSHVVSGYVAEAIKTAKD